MKLGVQFEKSFSCVNFRRNSAVESLDTSSMVLQKLIALILNHPNVGPRLVQQLSETAIIRRAARATAYVYLRGKQAVEEGGRSGVADSAVKGSQSFSQSFQAELRKGWQEAQSEMRRKK